MLLEIYLSLSRLFAKEGRVSAHTRTMACSNQPFFWYEILCVPQPSCNNRTSERTFDNKYDQTQICTTGPLRERLTRIMTKTQIYTNRYVKDAKKETCPDLVLASVAKPRCGYGSSGVSATYGGSRQQDGAELCRKTMGKGEDGTRNPTDVEGLQLQGWSDLPADQGYAPHRRTGGRYGGNGGPRRSKSPSTSCCCEWRPPTASCCKRIA